MTDDQKHRLLHHARIRRAKFWLRYMPRRARFHTYPVVGRFAAFARRRSYLWRFNYPQIRPAFYVGSVLTLLPIPAQIPIGFLLCLLFRTNFMIMASLQFVSNTATVVPFLYGTYKLGAITLDVTGFTPHYDPAPAVYTGPLTVQPVVVNPPLSDAPADLEAPPPEPEPTPWKDRLYRVLGDLLPPRGQPISNTDWLRIIAHLIASIIIGCIIAGLVMGAALDLLWRWLVLPATRHHAASKPVTAIVTPHDTASLAATTNPLPPAAPPIDQTIP